MCNTNIVHSLTAILTALLIIAVSIPLLKGKIGMNGWYGIRIPKSFQSEQNWYKINKYGAQRLILWSMVPLVTGILLLFIPIGFIAAFAVTLFVIVVFIGIIPIIQILLFAKKL